MKISSNKIASRTFLWTYVAMVKAYAARRKIGTMTRSSWKNHWMRTAAMQPVIPGHSAQRNAECLHAPNIRRRGRIGFLHVSMPHDWKSCPSTSPTHLGQQASRVGAHSVLQRNTSGNARLPPAQLTCMAGLRAF